MKFIIAALLAVALIQLAPSPEQYINTTTQEPAAADVRPTQANQVSQPERKAPAKQPAKSQPEKAAAKPSPTPTVLTNKQQLMQEAGIPEADWNAVDYIVSKESSWRHNVWNASGSGAYGLCQALPASKMSSAGSDYMTNPLTQLRWCHNYAHKRYGGWWHSFAFWQANRWW